MKKLVLATLISGAVLAGNAMAADETSGQIQFKGKVVQQSCVVATDSRDQIIVLDSVPTNRLTADGNTAVPTPFTIKVSGCSTTQGNATRVKARFTSIANVVPGSFTLKNTATTEAATNVNIKLFNEDGTTGIKPMNVAITNGGNGTTYTQQSDDQADFKDITGGELPLRYVAAYYATGQATPGNVESAVDFELAYE